jgi:hypothetical protein
MVSLWPELNNKTPRELWPSLVSVVFSVSLVTRTVAALFGHGRFTVL